MGQLSKSNERRREGDGGFGAVSLTEAGGVQKRPPYFRIRLLLQLRASYHLCFLFLFLLFFFVPF